MARSKEFVEDEVLDKAVQLFWCKGYNGCSAQDIVDAVGISRSSLYDTFTDKRTLFIKSLQHYRSKMAAAFIELVSNSDNVHQTIKQIFQMAVSQSIQDKNRKGCFMVNSSIELAAHDKEIAAIVNENMDDIEEALFRALKKGQDAGQISKSSSPRALARFLFNTISGLRVAARSGADKKVMDDIVKVSLSVL